MLHCVFVLFICMQSCARALWPRMQMFWLHLNPCIPQGGLSLVLLLSYWSSKVIASVSYTLKIETEAFITRSHSHYWTIIHHHLFIPTTVFSSLVLFDFTLLSHKLIYISFTIYHSTIHNHSLTSLKRICVRANQSFKLASITSESIKAQQYA